MCNTNLTMGWSSGPRSAGVASHEFCVFELKILVPNKTHERFPLTVYMRPAVTTHWLAPHSVLNSGRVLARLIGKISIGSFRQTDCSEIREMVSGLCNESIVFKKYVYTFYESIWSFWLVLTV